MCEQHHIENILNDMIDNVCFIKETTYKKNK